jgi:hypothetical protein
LNAVARHEFAVLGGDLLVDTRIGNQLDLRLQIAVK